MVDRIVHSDKTVLLVGAGELRPGELTQSLAPQIPVIAADGGARAALEAGVVPDAVIGDMDSVPDDPRLKGRLFPVTEQDSTDFGKCLARIEAPLILALGFGGGRLDHTLAVMTTLAHFAHRKVVAAVGESVVCLAPPVIDLPLEAGEVVSLWPLGPVMARSEGLRWPLDGLAFAPDGQIGTSNAATGPARITVEAPRMLLILPAGRRPLLERQLTACDGWPAPAG